MNEVVVEQQINLAEVEAQVFVVEVAAEGLRGERGPSGVAGDSFEFSQASPALQWSISHNLGRRPVVELFSVGGAEIDADVLHLSTDQVLVTFLLPTAGSARLI